MGYDKILLDVGDFGLYQKLLCGIFVFYTTFLCGLNYYTQVFIFDTPIHRCADPVTDHHERSSSALWSDTLPWTPREKGYPSGCKMLDTSRFGDSVFVNKSANYYGSLGLQDTDPEYFSAIRRGVITFVEETPHKSCDNGWNYDNSLIFNTITSENDWVCDEDYKPLIIHTVFWIGNTVGCFIWGFTNDFFGRKPTVLLTMAVYFIGGVATLFAPSFNLLVASR